MKWTCNMGDCADDALDREISEWIEEDQEQYDEPEMDSYPTHFPNRKTKPMKEQEPIQDAEVTDTSVMKLNNPPPAVTEKSHAVTPTEAKNSAVASLTMSAYAKASSLKLTSEEIAALQKDFPDEAFKPGAGGKTHLIYIEHAYLRDRLNEVFGMGSWAIVPRNRWAEPFKTESGKDGSRVYVEGMLVIRECFVAEAVGEMEYYPHNASQNYGDAVEGAKTACLRRCCKEFGIGLQAWKKDWCQGWLDRQNASRRRPPVAPQATASQRPATQANPAKVWTAADYLKHFKSLVEAARKQDMVRQFFIDLGWLIPNETIDGLPDDKVPHSKEEMSLLWTAVESWSKDGKAVQPYPIRKEVSEPAPKVQLPPKTETKHKFPADLDPEDDDGEPATDAESETWYSFIVPIPRKGMKRDEYLKEPDTIGSLYEARHDDEDARRRLWGFATNYQPEARTVGGKTYQPSANDHEFRKQLDLFLEWFEHNHPDEKL